MMNLLRPFFGWVWREKEREREGTRRVDFALKKVDFLPRNERALRYAECRAGGRRRWIWLGRIHGDLRQDQGRRGTMSVSRFRSNIFAFVDGDDPLILSRTQTRHLASLSHSRDLVFPPKSIAASSSFQTAQAAEAEGI